MRYRCINWLLDPCGKGSSSVKRAIFICALVCAGCAGPTAEEQEDELGLEQRQARCRAALRDERVWCREGLKKDDAPTSRNCLESRMRIDRHCY